jgi:hypothetical protein
MNAISTNRKHRFRYFFFRNARVCLLKGFGVASKKTIKRQLKPEPEIFFPNDFFSKGTDEFCWKIGI